MHLHYIHHHRGVHKIHAFLLDRIHDDIHFNLCFPIRSRCALEAETEAPLRFPPRSEALVKARRYPQAVPRFARECVHAHKTSQTADKEVGILKPDARAATRKRMAAATIGKNLKKLQNDPSPTRETKFRAHSSARTTRTWNMKQGVPACR